MPVTPTDLDTIPLGLEIVVPTSDSFTTALPPPDTMGTLDKVYFNEENSLYTYVHTVTPSIINISEFNTGFSVNGFTGTAGWDFDDSAAAGGAGTSSDFSIAFETDGTLDWGTVFTQLGSSGWDSTEPITFFFQSTIPPGRGDYNLINSEVGSAESYAPVPEPATLGLLGSGLVSLGWTARRRGQVKATAA